MPPQHPKLNCLTVSSLGLGFWLVGWLVFLWDLVTQDILNLFREKKIKNSTITVTTLISG